MRQCNEKQLEELETIGITKEMLDELKLGVGQKIVKAIKAQEEGMDEDFSKEYGKE